MARELKFGVPLTFDHGSWRGIVLASDGNNFTGGVDLETNIIYLGPLAPSPVESENHYNTIAPRGSQIVAGKHIKPIVHSNLGNNTSHLQLVLHVIQSLSLPDPKNDYSRFCGFALRFEPENRIAMTGTSRTLNVLANGQLEPSIVDALFDYLTAELGKLPVNRTVYKAQPRTSPLAVAAAVSGSSAVAGARMSMLSQMQGVGGIQGFQLKNKAPRK